MRHVRKGDEVIVVAGKDKGKRGKVLFVDRKKNRVKVEKIALIKRHVKPSQKNPQGGIVEKEASIHLSNLMLVCPKTGKPTRIGTRVLEDGKRVRYSKKAKELVD